MEEIENDIETLEHAIFNGQLDGTARIYELKQQVNHLYRAVHPLLVPLAELEDGDFKDVSHALLRYFRDAADNVRRIHEEVSPSASSSTASSTPTRR